MSSRLNFYELDDFNDEWEVKILSITHIKKEGKWISGLTEALLNCKEEMNEVLVNKIFKEHIKYIKEIIDSTSSYEEYKLLCMRQLKVICESEDVNFKAYAENINIMFKLIAVYKNAPLRYEMEAHNNIVRYVTYQIIKCIDFLISSSNQNSEKNISNKDIKKRVKAYNRIIEINNIIHDSSDEVYRMIYILNDIVNTIYLYVK